MTDDSQLDRFGEAVEEKKQRAEQASHDQHGHSPSDSPVSAEDEQRPRVEPGRPQDERDVRAKSSGHGKKTADKWNQ